MNNKIIKYKNEILIFISTFMFGFFAHGYIYLNGIFSHDASRIFQNDFTYQISLGRFLQPLYLWVRGYICAPFLIGIISLLFLSLSICFIQKIFKLKKNSSLVILCGILAINSTISLGNASYMPWSDIYMLSFFVSTIGVYSFVENKKYGSLVTVFCVIIISGLYQPYFATMVILFMLYELKRLFDKEDAKNVFFDGIKSVICMIVGLLLYYFILNIILDFTNVQLSSGSNSIDSVGNFANTSVLGLIIDTYIYCLKSFIRPLTYHHNFVGIINISIFLITVLGICSILKKDNIIKIERLLVVLILLLMPFGMNVIYFISKGSIHELVVYSFFLSYLLVIIVYDLCDVKKLFSKAIIIMMCIIIFNNLIYSNQLYLKKDLEYKATLSVMTRILDKIEEVEGYQPGLTPVAFVGGFAKSPIANYRFGFEEIVGIGINNFGPYSITYDLTFYWYITEVLGYPILIKSESEFIDMDVVKKMPVFPNKDSIKKINDTIVVKVSW